MRIWMWDGKNEWDGERNVGGIKVSELEDKR